MFLAIASGVGLSIAAFLVMMSLNSGWLFGPNSRRYAPDFVVFWSAGHQALRGAAIAAYDFHTQHALEVSIIGREFGRALPWSYPPIFFFVASILACMPYLTAFAAWNGACLILQGGTFASIVRSRLGFFAAWAPPWVFLNVINGQNGLLTASLFGIVLVNLETRPIVSGLVLGLLSYKPQFALLFPLALAAGGYWRTFAAAAASTIVLTASSAVIFGPETFGAFLDGLSHGTKDYLVSNGIGWNKLQSMYGLARWLGASNGIAWIMQCGMAACAALAVIQVWRSEVSTNLKAATLAVATLLVSPYVLIYDLAVASVAIAFLMRDRFFDRLELVALVFCLPAIMGYSYPIGLLALVALSAIIVGRVVRKEHRLSPVEGEPSWLQMRKTGLPLVRQAGSRNASV
jgi:hypothetical protein